MEFKRVPFRLYRQELSFFLTRSQSARGARRPPPSPPNCLSHPHAEGPLRLGGRGGGGEYRRPQAGAGLAGPPARRPRPRPALAWRANSTRRRAGTFRGGRMPDELTPADAVVVTWNSRDIVLRCVECLEHAGVARVLVVDNASEDGTAEALSGRVDVVRL